MEDQNDDMLDRLAKHPITPPRDADEEPTDSNPVPLSPTEPKRRTSDGATEPSTELRVAAVPAAGLSGGSTVGAGALPGGLPFDKDRERDETPKR